jgi:predicted nucleic acid-binding protein
MILVDTPVIVAWLDPNHPQHDACCRALDGCAAVDELAISVLTLAELVAGGRNSGALKEDLAGFSRIAVDEAVALCAGTRLSSIPVRNRRAAPSLLSALVWEQAVALKVPILAMEAPKLAGLARVPVLLPIYLRASGIRRKLRTS